MNLFFYKKTIIPSLQNFFNEKVFISADRSIIFLCGGADENKSARYIFLKYLQKHKPDLDITIADTFFKIAKSDDDLLTLENQLAEFADCIVLFVESPGSIAELGAFANHEKLVTKLLVINDNNFKNYSSFINEGCIKRVEAKSNFTPIIFCDMSTPLYIAQKIIDTIDMTKRKRRRSFILGHENFNQKEQLYFLITLLTLLNPINKTDLINIASSFKFFTKEQEIIKMLHIIVTLGYAHSPDEKYLYPTKHYLEPFLQHSKTSQMKKIRANILQCYRKNDISRIHSLNAQTAFEGNKK